MIPEVFRASLSFILYSIYFSLLVMSLQKLPKFFEVVIYVIANFKQGKQWMGNDFNYDRFKFNLCGKT